LLSLEVITRNGLIKLEKSEDYVMYLMNLNYLFILLGIYDEPEVEMI
jgi:hypothetical protein